MKLKFIGFVLGVVLCVPGITAFEALTGKHGYGVVVPVVILVAAIFFMNSWSLERKVIGRWLLWGAIASLPIYAIFLIIFTVASGSKIFC